MLHCRSPSLQIAAHDNRTAIARGSEDAFQLMFLNNDTLSKMVRYFRMGQALMPLA